jgi:hypothetical protein
MMQGTYNAKGDRWIERILSVRETCRLQGRPTFPVLVEAVTCSFNGQPPDMGRKQQRYAKLHSVLEDAVVSRGYQILGSAIPEQNVQEIEKQREVKGLIFLLS